MATEHERMHDGALARLRDILMRASASEATEDVTGSLPPAWWRVAIHPMPATFRAWSRRAGPLWITLSLIVGSVLVGLDAAMEAFFNPLVETLQLNPQGRYLFDPSVSHVLARAVASTISFVPITFTVLLAIAYFTRQHQTGGTRQQLAALFPAWALAHPAFGLAQLISSACALGLAAMLQQMHVTSSAASAGIAYDVLSFVAGAVLVWLVLCYQFSLFSAAVRSVVPQPVVTVGCLAVGVYLVAGFLIGYAVTLAAQALGIPGSLFGQ